MDLALLILITLLHLWNDGLHLPNRQESTLANHFINHESNFYCLELENFRTLSKHMHKRNIETLQILIKNNENC